MPFARSARVCGQILFDLRKACQNYVAHDLQALCRDLIDRVLLGMPVFVTIQLNDVERIDAHAQTRFMIVAADTFISIDEDFVMTQLAASLPDNILHPSCAHRVAAELKVLEAHHVEQDHCANSTRFICLLELFDKMTAAVGVVRSAGLAALVPAGTKSFFTVEEYKPIRELWLWNAGRVDSSQLKQLAY